MTSSQRDKSKKDPSTSAEKNGRKSRVSAKASAPVRTGNAGRRSKEEAKVSPLAEKKERKRKAEALSSDLPAPPPEKKAEVLRHQPFMIFHHEIMQVKKSPTYVSAQAMKRLSEHINSSSGYLELDWPRNRDTQLLLMQLEIDPIKKGKCTLSFYDAANAKELPSNRSPFLRMHLEKGEWKKEAGVPSPQWQDIDLEDLELYFKWLLNVKEEKADPGIVVPAARNKEAQPLKDDEFKTLIAAYKDHNITTRMRLVINRNPTLGFVFHVEHKALNNVTHVLRVEFYPQKYHSWVLSPFSLFKRHYSAENKKQLTQYNNKELGGALKCWGVKVTESKTKDELFTGWITPDGEAGEVYDVKKGGKSKISGTEVLRFYERLEDFLRIKTMYLCDMARITCGETEVPLRLLRVLATGQGLYKGFELVDCKDMQPGWNLGRSITQDVNQYRASVNTLRNLPFSEMLKHYQSCTINPTDNLAAQQKMVSALAASQTKNDLLQGFHKRFREETPTRVLTIEELGQLNQAYLTLGQFCAAVHADRSAQQILLNMFTILFDADLRRFDLSNSLLDACGNETASGFQLDMDSQAQLNVPPEKIHIAGHTARLLHWRFLAKERKDPAPPHAVMSPAPAAAADENNMKLG